MEAECGIVEKVEKNRVLVSSDPISFCSNCTNKSCNMKSSEVKNRQLWIENTLNAKVGDKVYFEVSPKSVVVSAFILYGFPLLFLFIGIICSKYLPLIIDAELSSIIYGFLFFVLSYIILAYLSNRKFNNFLKVKMLKIEQNN